MRTMLLHCRYPSCVHEGYTKLAALSGETDIDRSALGLSELYFDTITSQVHRSRNELRKTECIWTLKALQRWSIPSLEMVPTPIVHHDPQGIHKLARISCMSFQQAGTLRSIGAGCYCRTSRVDHLYPSIL
jgi:hypothetical protein